MSYQGTFKVGENTKKLPGYLQAPGPYAGGGRQYKQEVNGIIPGYGGHIPAARDEVGMSAVGNVPLYGAKAQSPMGHPSLGGGIIGGKVRFEGMTAGMTDNRKEYKDVSTGVLPGYAGFVPAARDKYGGTYRGGGRLTKREY